MEQNQQTTLTVLGVAAIDVQLTQAAFATLAHDPEVLGLDLTTALALDDLTRTLQIDPATVEVIPVPLYWENLGVE